MMDKKTTSYIDKALGSSDAFHRIVTAFAAKKRKRAKRVGIVVVVFIIFGLLLFFTQKAFVYDYLDRLFIGELTEDEIGYGILFFLAVIFFLMGYLNFGYNRDASQDRQQVYDTIRSVLLPTISPPTVSASTEIGLFPYSLDQLDDILPRFKKHNRIKTYGRAIHTSQCDGIEIHTKEISLDQIVKKDQKMSIICMYDCLLRRQSYPLCHWMREGANIMKQHGIEHFCCQKNAGEYSL